MKVNSVSPSRRYLGFLTTLCVMCRRKRYYRKFEPLHFVNNRTGIITHSSEHRKFHFFDALFRISIVRRNNSWNWSISRRKWCSTYYCGDENCSGDGATFQHTSIGLDNECSMRNNMISKIFVGALLWENGIINIA